MTKTITMYILCNEVRKIYVKFLKMFEKFGGFFKYI